MDVVLGRSASRDGLLVRVGCEQAEPARGRCFGGWRGSSRLQCGRGVPSERHPEDGEHRSLGHRAGGRDREHGVGLGQVCRGDGCASAGRAEGCAGRTKGNRRRRRGGSHRRLGCLECRQRGRRGSGVGAGPEAGAAAGGGLAATRGAAPGRWPRAVAGTEVRGAGAVEAAAAADDASAGGAEIAGAWRSRLGAAGGGSSSVRIPKTRRSASRPISASIGSAWNIFLMAASRRWRTTR